MRCILADAKRQLRMRPPESTESCRYLLSVVNCGIFRLNFLLFANWIEMNWSWSSVEMTSYDNINKTIKINKRKSFVFINYFFFIKQNLSWTADPPHVVYTVKMLHCIYQSSGNTNEWSKRHVNMFTKSSKAWFNLIIISTSSSMA